MSLAAPSATGTAVAEAPVDIADLWRRARVPALVVVIAGALVVLLAAVSSTSHNGYLDPRNTAPQGGHALAALLEDRGITVTIPTALPEVTRRSTTVLLSDPQALSTGALTAIANGAATVVVVDPTARELSALGIPATLDSELSATTLGPGCAVPPAVTAGDVRIAGDLYRIGPGATGCYRAGGDAALVKAQRPDGAPTYAIGSTSTLSNAELATQGDAALGLGLLDSTQVEWVPAGLAGPVPKSQRGLFNLLPSRLLWATLQLFVALAVLALWRGRRLGNPVAEPLPVIVRAAETVEGRARLMHAAKARDGAAHALREATVRRLSAALRLDADEDPATVTALVAERTHMPTTEVGALLYGGEPRDDATLVRLAQDLPRLETAVQRGERPL